MSRKTAAPKPARRDAVDAAAYHHGDLRNALLHTAARILAEEGAAAVGIREIARRAGVSHAAPYRHYANREALLADLAGLGFERLRERFERLSARGGAERRFIDMARSYVQFALDEPETYRLMFGETIDKRAHPELMRISGRAYDALSEAVQALGVAAPATLETLGAWAMAHGVARLVLDHRIDAHQDERVDPDRLIRHVAEVFVAGLRTPQLQRRS